MYDVWRKRQWSFPPFVSLHTPALAGYKNVTPHLSEAHPTLGICIFRIIFVSLEVAKSIMLKNVYNLKQYEQTS